MKMVIGRRSNEHNSAILQAIEVKQTLLNFFFDSLSNDTKLYGFGWKNAKSAGLPIYTDQMKRGYLPSLNFVNSASLYHLHEHVSRIHKHWHRNKKIGDFIHVMVSDIEITTGFLEMVSKVVVGPGRAAGIFHFHDILHQWNNWTSYIMRKKYSHENISSILNVSDD